MPVIKIEATWRSTHEVEVSDEELAKIQDAPQLWGSYPDHLLDEVQQPTCAELVELSL